MSRPPAARGVFVGRALLWVCALGAAASAVASLAAVADAAPEAKVAEAWRGYGFLVFAGLFALLALRPGQHPVVWVLVIGHKAAMTVTALAWTRSGVPDTTTVAVADGVVTVFLVAAYLLTRPARTSPDRNPDREDAGNR